MKFYHITDAPLRIYGLAVADRKKRRYWKLPPEILEQFPQYEFLGRRCAGGRVRFCTDSESLLVRMTLAETKEDLNIPLIRTFCKRPMSPSSELSEKRIQSFPL